MSDELRQKMCEIGERAYARGLVCGAEGNLSARLPDGSVLCTPSGICKGRMTPADLCLVSPRGDLLSGARRASSEIQLHLALYRAASQIAAVVHTHAPHGTALALLGETVPRGILPEVDYFLGDVPLIAYETPGTVALGERVAPWAARARAAILQNHGVVTWAGDLESALVLTETLESACRAYSIARQLGAVQKLPAARLRELRPGGAT